MKNLNKLKDAKYEIKNLLIGPNRSLKEREEVRRLIAKAKNLNEKEQGDYVHLVRGLQIIIMRKKPQITTDTLIQDKLHEITWRMNQEKCKPDFIALVEGKPKNSRAEWNPVWHKI